MQKIGSVIKNPEIQAIAGVILAAIDDPSKHTKKCLRVLLETAFIHVIDAASLALIMPILERALNDRSTETKKAAAQIIGNMYSLTDAKDLEPYLPSLLPGVQEALLDPEPSVRGIAAKVRTPGSCIVLAVCCSVRDVKSAVPLAVRNVLCDGFIG